MKIRKNVSYVSSLIAAAFLSIGISSHLSAATVTVDASNHYQQIVGFGTCSVGWDGTMDAYYATPAFLTQYVDEMGLNIYRMPLWPEVLTQIITNAEDINYGIFNTNNTRARSYINVATDLHEKDPDMKLIMTSWSPPSWMKTNNSINNGGSLRTDRYEHFARYLLAWCKYMTEQVGMRPYALSFQNELLFAQGYESCVWTVEEYLNFTKLLGPFLEENGFGDVLIFGPEHMTASSQQTMDYVHAIMEDPEAAPYFHVVASHGYTDGIQADDNPLSASNLFNQWRKYPLQYWMTETSGEPVTFNGALDGVAGAIHNSLVGGRASAYVYWQFAGPQPNEFSLRGFDIAPKRYYAFRHYSKWIRANSWRVSATTEEATKLSVSAFVSEDEQEITVVLLNRDIAAQTVALDFAQTPGLTSVSVYRTSSTEDTAKLADIAISDGQATLEMPARSLVTLVGNLDGYVKPTYTADFTPITVSAGSGALSIPISATDESGTWRVEGAVNWLTSETPTGTGSGNALVNISRNATANARTGVIEISGQLLTINQSANPGLTFAGYGTTISGNGAFGEVTIDAFGADGRNRQWTATSSADWLVLTSASGTGAGTISFTADKNTGTEPRTATISLEEETYTITQEASNGSIFPALGWVPSIGFYYDGFYPFVYLWGTLEWVYVPEGYTYEEGFFFWRFNAEHWGFTAGEWLPWYFPFTEAGAEDAIDLTVPVP